MAVLLFLAVTLAAFAGRQAMLGAAAVRQCDAQLAVGDLAGAIDAARGAAEARAPFSPYPERGYSRLEAIARASEARDDDATAAAAWRAVRAAALATVTVGGPSPHLAAANEGLSRLSRSARTVADARPADPAAFHDAMMTMLARDDTPSTASFVLLGAGGLAFFVGALQALLLAPGASRRARVVRASIAAAGLGLALLAYLRN